MGFEAVYTVTGQTYSRKVDSQVLDVLSGLGQSAHKFGTDLRLLAHRQEVDEPFEAYQVGCGISFTFGGVRIDPDTGQVIDGDMNPIPGLYAAGELVGGIFYFNYPGGTGLMSGTVFGRIAGHGAARQGNA